MRGPSYIQFDNDEYYYAPAQWSVDVASYDAITNRLERGIYSLLCGVQGYEVENVAYVGSYEPGYNIYRIWIYSDSIPDTAEVLQKFIATPNIRVVAINGRLIRA